MSGHRLAKKRAAHIGACWTVKNATMMIMGDPCTRACASLQRAHHGLPEEMATHRAGTGSPAPVRGDGLKHVVITSVDRDDLADGGALHFAEVVRAIRREAPLATIEILTPDFLRKDGAAEVVIDARPDVFNHNLETVPRLYLRIRPGARYYHSLRLLERVKERDPAQFTKSGVMVGLGEERLEVHQVMDDMRSADVDFSHGPVPAADAGATPRWTLRQPRRVQGLRGERPRQGLPDGLGQPLTRSSHHAGEDFARLRAARRGPTGSPAPRGGRFQRVLLHPESGEVGATCAATPLHHLHDSSGPGPSGGRGGAHQFRRGQTARVSASGSPPWWAWTGRRGRSRPI